MHALEAPIPDKGQLRTLFNRYGKDDVRYALATMYSDRCCYCEGRIGVVVYGQIEHRQPKKLFPEKTFVWENLHWACQPCNVQKGAKWDRCFPILDGVLDPISHHLTYRIGG